MTASLRELSQTKMDYAYMQCLWQGDENAPEDVKSHPSNSRHSYNTVVHCSAGAMSHKLTSFRLDLHVHAATRPPRKLKGAIMKECTIEGQHGIRAGCPPWCLYWTRVSLSGCCCGQEAPLGREPEGLNESSTCGREQEISR